MSEVVSDICKDIWVIDLHQDYFWDTARRLKETWHLSENQMKIFDRFVWAYWDFSEYRKANVSLFFSALFCYSYKIDKDTPLLQFDETLYQTYLEIIREFEERKSITIVKTKEDLRSCLKEKQAKGDFPQDILLHIEGANWIKTKEDIDSVFEDGVRSIWLVRNDDNSIAHAHGSDQWLTKTWEDLIQYMMETWIMIDLAHASHQTMIDVLTLANKKWVSVMNTHANINTLRIHGRNVQDDVLDLLKKNWWVVWLSIYSDFIHDSPTKKRATIEQYMQQIQYSINRWLEHNIALGTDFHGIGKWTAVEWVDTIADLDTLKQAVSEKFGVPFARAFFLENAERVMKNILM